MYTVKTRNLS